jgi:hypothetical protein
MRVTGSAGRVARTNLSAPVDHSAYEDLTCPIDCADSSKPARRTSSPSAGGPFEPSFGLSGVRFAAWTSGMRSGLQRFQESKQAHVDPFCCYRRRESFAPPSAKRVLEAALDRVRRSFRLCVYGTVVMPEHVHLLLGEPQHSTLADAVKSLK